MKRLISEKYALLVLLLVVFLASVQALSQTKSQPVSNSKVILKLSDLKLKLTPRMESEEIPLLSRAPASLLSTSQAMYSPSKRGRLVNLQLKVSEVNLTPTHSTPVSVQQGRDLSSSFKSNPYYIPACSELIRFQSKRCNGSPRSSSYKNNRDFFSV